MDMKETQLGLDLHSVYETVSGEIGSKAIPQGATVTLLRLRGCNLRCPYCDAKGTQEPSPTNVPLRAIGDIQEMLIPHLQHTGGRLLVTGGEPLLQQEALGALLMNLSRSGVLECVNIETNGTLMPDKLLQSIGGTLPEFVYFLVDIKWYNSGNVHDSIFKRIRVDREWFTCHSTYVGIPIPQVAAFKMLVEEVEDFRWIAAFIQETCRINPLVTAPFAVGVIAEGNITESLASLNQLAKAIVEKQAPNIYLNFQLHKLCNVE